MGRPRHLNPNCDPSRQPAKPCRRCGLWPPTVVFLWRTRRASWTSWCRDCIYVYNCQYARSPHRKAAQRRYEQSEKGKAVKARYRASAKGIAARRRADAKVLRKVKNGLRREQARLRVLTSIRSRTLAQARLQAYQRELDRLTQRTTPR